MTPRNPGERCLLQIGCKADRRLQAMSHVSVAASRRQDVGTGIVPELCRRAAESGTDQQWGRGMITPSRARELLELARRAGTWVALDGQAIGYDRRNVRLATLS